MDAPLLRAFADPQSPWAPPAIRATLLGEAIEDAARDLDAAGLSPDAPWGSVHRLTLRHPLGTAPWLAPAVNRGPYPMPGGPYTVCSGQYFHDRPAAMVVGPSYRQVVDLADPEGTGRMITFGGQSGWCGSPHYDDLTPLWRAGETLPMRLDARPERATRLTLVPA
jgi:penicillin amidase